MKYRFLEHTADIKFVAFGKSLEKAFKNSALALKESMLKKRVRRKIKREIIVKGDNLENLLYNFLEEILFLFDSENFLSGKVKKLKINEENLTLRAILLGDFSNNYTFNSHIKAITYHGMKIKKIKKSYLCYVVLDV